MDYRSIQKSVRANNRKSKKSGASPPTQASLVLPHSSCGTAWVAPSWHKQSHCHYTRVEALISKRSHTRAYISSQNCNMMLQQLFVFGLEVGLKLKSPALISGRGKHKKSTCFWLHGSWFIHLPVWKQQRVWVTGLWLARTSGPGGKPELSPPRQLLASRLLAHYSPFRAPRGEKRLHVFPSLGVRLGLLCRNII